MYATGGDRMKASVQAPFDAAAASNPVRVAAWPDAAVEPRPHTLRPRVRDTLVERCERESAESRERPGMLGIVQVRPLIEAPRTGASPMAITPGHRPGLRRAAFEPALPACEDAPCAAPTACSC